MKKQVLKYPLPIELPKSIIGGQYASVWSKKTRKVVQTTMGAHLLKRLLPHGAFEAHERARDCGQALNINWRIPDKFQRSQQDILATSKVG